LKADSIILATPVYSGNPTGLLLSFMNRLHAIDPQMKKEKKTMQFIIVGERRRRGMDTAQMALMRFVMHSRFIYVPSEVHDCVGVQIVSKNPPNEKLTSGKTGALQDQVGMTSLKEMIKEIVNFTKLLRAGEEKTK
jgi:multimeric flavodoxin WrbA